ncbi:MAG: hypothetical protein VX777_08540 [Chlamydiota bacterium]|nr:hypothetical protein [Chlamydiota bacterium]
MDFETQMINRTRKIVETSISGKYNSEGLNVDVYTVFLRSQIHPDFEIEYTIPVA